MNVEEAAKVVSTMPETSLREAVEELMKTDPVLWSVVHRRLRGQPLVFDNSANLTREALDLAKRKAKNLPTFRQDHQSRLLRHRPFLVVPMRDDHPHKVYQKARQMGVSEAELNEVLWFLSTNSNTKAIITFPRDAGLKKFSMTRVDPAFKETPRMRALLTGADGVYLKKILDSFLILTSAWDSNLGEGTDADMVTLDERDRMNPAVEQAFRASLKSSKWGLFREVSTPTLPTVGVAKSYALSDQRCWLMRCSKCGLEQEILYPDNVVQVKDVKAGAKELPEDSYAFLCRLERCRGVMNRMTGRWVAKRPSVENIRGYHMSWCICPWISATELMQEKINLQYFQLFLNYALGLPSQGGNDFLSDGDLLLACAGHSLIDARTDEWTDVCAGIDWGAINWVVVTARNKYNNRVYVIGVAWFDDDPRDPLSGSAKAIEAYLAPFRPDVIVADDGFGKDRNAYLLKKFDESGGAQFWGCRYNPAPKNTRQFNPVWSEAGNQVMVDRTMWLKMTCRAVKTMEVGLPDPDTEEGGLLNEHLKALVPRIEEVEDVKKGTKETVEVVASKGPDHLAHCLLYCILGRTWMDANTLLGLITD